MRNYPVLLLAALLVAVVSYGLASAHGDEHEHAAKAVKYACPMNCVVSDKPGKCPVCGMDMEAIEQPQAEAAAGGVYYLPTSPTGKPLGDTPVFYDQDGRELRFADAADLAKFQKNPKLYLSKVDEQIIADQLPGYPLDTCPVTDEPLGGMGDAVNYVYGNRLVRFCCEGCTSEFESNPAQYLAKIDAAVIEKQKAGYPLDHCLVLTDEKLGDEDEQDIVVGGRLFRLCCPDCVEEVHSNPVKWIAKLDEAYAKAGNGAQT